MRFDIMTLFPEMVMNGLETSIIGRAVKNKILEIEAWNIRDYAFNKHQFVFFRKIFCHLLVKRLPLWGKINHTWSLSFREGCFFLNGKIGLVNRLCLHQHSCAAAIRIIIHTAVLVKCVVPDIPGFNLKNFILPAIHDCILDVDTENRKMTVHLMDGLI